MHVVQTMYLEDCSLSLHYINRVPFASTSSAHCIPTAPPFLFPSSMSNEQCAVDALSHLKDASEIKWFNDPDDTEALPCTAFTSASTSMAAANIVPGSEPIAREGQYFV